MKRILTLTAFALAGFAVASAAQPVFVVDTIVTAKDVMVTTTYPITDPKTGIISGPAFQLQAFGAGSPYGGTAPLPLVSFRYNGTLSFDVPTATVAFNSSMAGPYPCKVTAKPAGYITVMIGARYVLLPYFDVPLSCEADAPATTDAALAVRTPRFSEGGQRNTAPLEFVDTSAGGR